MPPTRLISIGVPFLMDTEDEVCAMPNRRCLGMVMPADATLEVANAVDAMTWEALTLTDGGFETAAAFIRNGTSTDCTVVLRAN